MKIVSSDTQAYMNAEMHTYATYMHTHIQHLARLFVIAVDALVEHHAVYLTQDGRMSLAGLTSGDIAYVAGAIKSVTM